MQAPRIPATIAPDPRTVSTCNASSRLNLSPRPVPFLTLWWTTMIAAPLSLPSWANLEQKNCAASSLRSTSAPCRRLSGSRMTAARSGIRLAASSRASKASVVVSPRAGSSRTSRMSSPRQIWMLTMRSKASNSSALSSCPTRCVRCQIGSSGSSQSNTSVLPRTPGVNAGPSNARPVASDAASCKLMEVLPVPPAPQSTKGLPMSTMSLKAHFNSGGVWRV